MRDRIAIIDSQINRVVRIIQELLSSTRQRKPALARVTVEELVQPVAALMAPAFTAKGVTLSLEPAGKTLALSGDVEQLQQVLINLLSNALAATKAGGTVAVTVGEEAGMVTIAVRDTGCGIPEQDLKRAFEPFFSNKAIGDGTGLGLYLSQEIMTAHRGSLSLASTVGEGTTVRLAVPVYTEEGREVSSPEAVGKRDGS
jgi:signal transduction histidine kinase